MRQARSAGILLYRLGACGCEVLLVLPGGPYWRGRRSAGGWQIPKGAIEAGETPLAAAVREVAEEIGLTIDREPEPLCVVRQSGGKWVEAFTLRQDWDPATLRSAEIEIAWPPRSGRMLVIPEVVEARWFPIGSAGDAILPSQRPILDALSAKITA